MRHILSQPLGFRKGNQIIAATVQQIHRRMQPCKMTVRRYGGHFGGMFFIRQRQRPCLMGDIQNLCVLSPLLNVQFRNQLLFQCRIFIESRSKSCLDNSRVRGICEVFQMFVFQNHGPIRIGRFALDVSIRQRIGACCVETGHTKQVVVRADGMSVGVSVDDRGGGIADDIRARVFDPFFSTKGEGTGLGLAITRQIIEAHGGTVTCDARDGGGTRFRIMLPIAPSRSLAPRAKANVDG